MTPTAIIYARVSTPGQAEEGVSLDNQVERGHQLAAELGAVVRKVFRDEGISGRTDSRPAFQDAVAYCKAFEIDYFIVWSTSRFARNKIDAAMYKRSIRAGGTKIAYVSSKIDADSDEGWLMEGFLELMDEHVSRQISKDTVAAMIKNAREGFFNGGRPPFGYKVEAAGPNRKKLVVDLAEAAIAREIFRRYIEGLGTKSLAIVLNEAGTLRRGRPWSKNTLANMLKNRAYAGYTVFGRTRADGTARGEDDWITARSHEALITDEEFAMIQTITKTRAGDGGGNVRSSALFTGMLKCGECGSAMFTQSATGNGGRYHYYACSKGMRGQGCTSRRLRVDQVDAALRDRIIEQVLTRERLEEILKQIHASSGAWVKDRAAQRSAMVAQLRGLEERRRNLYDVLELQGRDAPNLGDMSPRLRELAAAINKLQGELDELEAAAPPAARIDETTATDMAEMFMLLISRATPQKLRAFFAGFIAEVRVIGDDLRVTYAPERLLVPTGLSLVHSAGNWLPGLGRMRTESFDLRIPRPLRRAA